MYRERASVAGGVVWTGSTPADAWQRVVPDGCMDLLWARDRVLVAGPDTAAHFARWKPDHTLVGLRMAPGVGAAVLGVPAHELRDMRVPLEDLWSAAEMRRICEEAASTQNPGRLLELTALRSLREGTGADPAMTAVAAVLNSGATVAQAAQQSGLGPRQLHRRSLVAFGYGPKTLARILRFNRALAAARTRAPFAEVATATGYADQAHLAREVKDLAGAPLGVLTG